MSRDFERQATATQQSEGDKRIETKATERDAVLRQLSASAEQYSLELASNRWVLPVLRYHITGRFGDRSHLWATVHTGLDFAAPTGTPIHAVATGIVTFAGFDGPYGFKTVVKLADGTELWYCHQSRIHVAVGDRVARGSVIGEIGATGNVTGPHLHLEVRPGGGEPVDPEVALPEHGVHP
jgi:murein DD-endopeptidase MepM/ murein hydrolase activator NlpD